MIETFLLASSICLSSGRSILSKKINQKDDNRFVFFTLQSAIFLICLLVTLFTNLSTFFVISPLTCLYGLLYGILLISAQWLYTIALKTGSAATCSMVYSFGFVIPTIASFIFFDDKITFLKIIGLFLAIIVILLISIYKDNKKENNKYIIPLLLSTLSSGGLGVLQKVQQRSEVANEKPSFLFAAFLVAFIISLFFTLINLKQMKKIKSNQLISASLCGFCFGSANIVNTTLAGMLPGSILFPIQNIGVILLVTLLGFIIFKEKPKINEICSFIIGIVSIILLSI